MPLFVPLSDGERSERTINRVALSLLRFPALRALDRFLCLPALMPNGVFCFGGRPAFAVAARAAGLVIPAYCLTAETFPDSVACL